MNLLRSHLMLIAAAGMISVLGLPLPDENDLSASLSATIDIEPRASQEDSTSDRMDHSYGAPTIVPPNLMEPQPSNMGPPSDPWHTPWSGPSVAVTGPSPNSPNARIAEDTEQQTPAQNLPSVQPVVVGPGGRKFRLKEQYTEPTDKKKIKKITKGLYTGGSKSLRQILRKLFDNVEKEGPKQIEKKRLLSDYSVYAQLPRGS
ncbi:hypothetical protein EV361DRAFT_508479 [Lentinula raphanica]|nr:hypothetical protein EV361DRAFT_508479 [Lentinula raphanica]